MVVRFRVLGPVDAVDADGRPLPLGGERQRALLAALLTHPGEVVSSDRLAHLLWGEDQPDNPAGALHSQVARLRQALRAGLTPREARLRDGGGLLTRPPGYLLAVEPEQVDAGRFERLVAEAAAAPPAEAARLLGEALALWRGPAYAGFADQRSPSWRRFAWRRPGSPPRNATAPPCWTPAAPPTPSRCWRRSSPSTRCASRPGRP
jgi:DNA-binding SARP family transcriptional activator